MFFYIVVAIFATLSIGIWIYMQQPKFGRKARGERLARIELSPNYRGGVFQNLEPTPQLTSDKSRARVMFDFMFEKRANTRPRVPIPAIKTDLKTLDKDRELLVWFGHSSYFIQSAGVRMLVDPLFGDASPVSFLNKPFEGTDIYNADDMPDIDYLIITHDHWDHLDFQTVLSLRNRVQKVVCPLGVGEYFEYWGYDPQQIIEMDWFEQYRADDRFAVHCLPARHFSGRTFKSSQTLWASYMITTNVQTIYLSGDGGFGQHYASIASQYPHIDIAIVENGQYNSDWKYLHLMPEDVVETVKILNPSRVFTGHNSKYALSNHPWDEPLDLAASIPTIVIPLIGEVVNLQDSIDEIDRWWSLSTKKGLITETL